MTPAQIDRIESFMADNERLMWIRHEQKRGYSRAPRWLELQAEALSLEAAMSKRVGSINIHGLFYELCRLIGVMQFDERLTEAPKLLARIDRYAATYPGYAAREQTLRKHVEEMRAIVGDPDPNNDDVRGDWKELRERVRAFVERAG